MQNTRRQELKLQLELYLEENYIGERLKPFGARVADPQTNGFHSEMPLHEESGAQYMVSSPTTGAKPKPKEEPKHFAEADEEKDDGIRYSIAPQAIQHRKEEPKFSLETGGDQDDAFEDIFKIFNRDDNVDSVPATGAAPSVPPAPSPAPVAAPSAPAAAPSVADEENLVTEFSSAPTQGKYSRTHTIRDYLIDQADNETFTEYMLRIIKERDLKEADVYNRVFMDRRHFNRIRNDPEYQPSKRTAMLLAIALHLSLSETQEFIGKAGFTMSHSSKTDLIVEFFIIKGNYNILEINEMLHEFNMPLLLKCD